MSFTWSARQRGGHRHWMELKKAGHSNQSRRAGPGGVPGTERARAARALAVLAAIMVVLIAPAAVPVVRGEVYLNEAVVRGTERVELYNSGPDSISLAGWRIEGSLGSYALPPVFIPPGGYLDFADLGEILDNIGGEISIIDDFDYRRDRVEYGDVGGAPLPHDEPSVSLCRAPDASDAPPLDPADDALYFTLDLSSTFGAPNDAPPPALGSSLLLNELDAGQGARGVGDQVELYNPTAAPVVTAGWYLTFGAGPTFFLPPVTIPAGGVQVFVLPGEIDLLATRLVYLFEPAGVRVDQLGFQGGPLAGGQPCLGRCPDGAGPNNGYDYRTSGGGATLLPLTCTLGERNVLAPECHGSVPVAPSTWGGVKTRYAR